MNASCLDEASALAFVAGELTPDVRSTMELHVDECASCRQVLAALVRRGPITGATWQVGTEVGRYTIRGVLGHGGMGSVYRADDPMLDRPVALKRLHASADAETRVRLVREARAAAQLADPNVVTIYEVGEVGGTPFIAMELVDGVTLTAWLAARERPWHAIVDVLAQAGRGLAAAHERRLVHRDFKPDNVLVDGRDRARVADFGLARAGVGSVADPTDSAAARGPDRLTATGSLAGTPAYLAPEVVEGGAPDARSDQYAFAVALFEALHGQHPFAGKTAETLWVEMAAGRIRDGGRPVPAWLDRHVRRGLSVDPAARWPDVAAFVHAIARPPRRRWRIAAAAAAAAALAAGGALWLRRAPENRCDDAGAPIAAQWPGRRLAIEAAAPSLAPALDAFAASWRSAAVSTCRASRARAPELVARQDACLDRARVHVQALLDEVAHGPAGLLAAADALPDLSPCSDLAQLEHGDPMPTAPRDRAALAAAEHDLADAVLARDRGDLAGAAALLDRAREVAQRLDANALDARVGLATHQVALDRGDPAAASSAALESWTAASASGDRDLALRAQLALLGSQAQHDPGALEAFHGIPEDLPPSREIAQLWSSYGDALQDAGRYADAGDAYRHAQAIRAQLLPADHIERLVGDYQIAGALLMQKRPAEALPILERVHGQLAARAAPLRRESIDVLHALAMAQRQLGHVDEALASTREVLARRTQVFGEHAAMTAIAREELASVLARADRHAEAATTREAAIADELAASGPTSANAAQARVNLAEDYLDLGRYDDALAALALARPILVADEGEHHPQIAIADLAAVRAIVQRAEKAKTTQGLDDARATLDGVAATFAKTFGATSQPIAAVDAVLAELEAARGRWAAADAADVAALAALGERGGADRADIELARAHVQWMLGQRGAARASATAAVADYASQPTRLAAARAWLARPT